MLCWNNSYMLKCFWERRIYLFAFEVIPQSWYDRNVSIFSRNQRHLILTKVTGCLTYDIFTHDPVGLHLIASIIVSARKQSYLSGNPWRLRCLLSLCFMLHSELMVMIAMKKYWRFDQTRLKWRVPAIVCGADIHGNMNVCFKYHWTW